MFPVLALKPEILEREMTALLGLEQRCLSVLVLCPRIYSSDAFLCFPLFTDEEIGREST